MNDQGEVSRVRLGGMLALAMGIGPLSIYVLAALAPAITAELELSRTQFGALASSAYLVTASLSITVGTIVDRLAPRRVLLALFLLAAASLGGIALATSYLVLIIAVIFSGLSQALANPVTNQTVAMMLPAGQRGVMMGIKQSGVQLCQALAGLTLPVLAVAAGWRAAAMSMPVLAVAGILLTVSVLPKPNAEPTASGGRGRGHPSNPLPRAVWWLAGYSVLIGAGLQATNVYVALYAYEFVGLDAVRAGATTGLLGGIGVLSRLAWGRASERVRTAQFSLALLAVGGMLAALLLNLAVSFPLLVWTGVVVHSLTVVAANVVTMMAVVRSVELAQLGRASGVIAFGLYLGFTLGPIAFGAITDLSGSYGAGWSLVLLGYLGAATLMVLWQRKERRADEAASLDEASAHE